MKPIVRCNTVASDDHAPQNLVAAPQSREHSSGFVAYPVVRPPVDIVFKLACAVRLQSIEVWTRVGSLRTTGLEVAVLRRGDADFVKVGHAFDLEEPADGALFVADSDRNNEASASDQLSEPTKLRRCQFFRTLGRQAPVVQVRISIKTTHQRCAPALRSVRIWGSPAACMSAAERQVHLDRWAARQPSIDFYGSSGSETVAPSSSSSANVNGDVVNSSHNAAPPPSASTSSRSPAAEHPIPEDYLDAITWEIMTLPMTLPCGRSVDRTTLERHHSNDASWGRSASDPFTGLLFTAERRPLLNAALKAEIDRYMLANQHRPDVRLAPRTVGTSTAKRTRDNGDGPARKWSRPGAAAERLRCHGCGATDVLYTIRTCKHCICRECLLGPERLRRFPESETFTPCARCERPFKSADVQRCYDRPIV